MTAVLFLTESFHPVLGGGEQHVLRLGRALAASGTPPIVVTRRGDPAWPERETLDGIEVVRVGRPGPPRTGKYAMVPAAMGALRALRRRYDVLVVRGTRVLGLPALIAARALGKPVVLQAEINGEMSGEVYTWGTSLDRGWRKQAVFAAVAARNRLMRDADSFVAMSRAIRDEFVAAGAARERVALIPHGVDTARFRPAADGERPALRRELGLPEAGRIIIYTGRLLRGKGLEALLEAFGAVAHEVPEAHLLLVGSGAGQSLSVEDDLRKAAAARSWGARVTFTGRVHDVERWLRASDVFAFPSVFEALGISLVEAAACGLPAVASRTGGIPDVVDEGRSGFLVTPGDTRSLAAALRRLLTDENLSREMGAAARAVAESRFDEGDAVDHYRALFREVAARSR